MNKKPTDFSQISLLSDQKAKQIVLKNSRENYEHVKLCKSLELAKHGMNASLGKEKKDLQKRLERHVRDSLNIDDIKCLRKYIGDERGENEFCSHFESGRRRSRSLSVSSEDQSRILISNGRQNNEEYHSKPVKIHNSSDTLRSGEKDLDSVSYATNEVGLDDHSKTGLEEIPDAKSGSWSPKVQREIDVANKQNLNVLCGSMANSAELDDMISNSRVMMKEEAASCENLDMNNNSLDYGTFYSRGEKVNSKGIDSDKIESGAADYSQNDKCNECTAKTVGEGTVCKQRQDSKRTALRKRLGLSPKECEEHEDGEVVEANGTREQSLNFSEVIDGKTSGGKKEVPLKSSNAAQTRRRCSWAGVSIKDRLHKRSEFNVILPLLNNTPGSRNDAIRSCGLDDWDKGESTRKPWETSPDPIACAITAEERRQGCEKLQGEMVKFHASLQKSNSVPAKLGAQRTKMYSEEPFYVHTRKLSRRISWQSTKLTGETLKELREIADNSKNESKTMTDEQMETPLVDLLPPIKLQSIYAQQCSKEKRDPHKLQERKRGDTKKKLYTEDKTTGFDKLTVRLKDCRYLRFRKDQNS